MKFARDTFPAGSVVAAIYSLVSSPCQGRPGVVLRFNDSRAWPKGMTQAQIDAKLSEAHAYGDLCVAADRPVLWSGRSVEWVPMTRLCRLSEISQFRTPASEELAALTAKAA